MISSQQFEEMATRAAGKKNAAVAVELADRRKQNHEEHEIQAALVKKCKELSGAFPELALLFAIPNQRADSTARLWYFLEGAKRGVPDLFLPVARCGRHGFFLEMKRTGGKHSAEQIAWGDALRANGYRVETAFSAGEGIELLLSYLRGK